MLPIATPQRTRVELTRRHDSRLQATSREFSEVLSVELGHERQMRSWVDYVQGVVVALRTRGFEVGGCDLHIESDVPSGSGLSSSAALEVAALRALRSAFSLPLSERDLALCAHAAEVEFVGAPVGLMDQFACAFGDEDHAILLDCRSLAMETIPLPFDLGLVVIDSGLRHDHAVGDYGQRRRETEAAARALGLPTLRDVQDAEALRRLPGLLERRARHVVTENARVLRAREALEEGDLIALGRLLDDSHASLRDWFEVSTTEVDLLVQIGREDAAILGARMTGGGFGGAVVMLAHRDEAYDAARRIALAYERRSGIRGQVLLPQ